MSIICCQANMEEQNDEAVILALEKILKTRQNEIGTYKYTV